MSVAVADSDFFVRVVFAAFMKVEMVQLLLSLYLQLLFKLQQRFLWYYGRTVVAENVTESDADVTTSVVKLLFA